MATKAKKKDKKEKAMTKSQFIADIAAKTELTKSQVSAVLDEQAALVARELKTNHPVAIPGLVKITLQRKEATAARPGRNPFTGEAITIKAKPARKVVRVKALKALKDMA
jgi:nucleoid DNA-binding protein